MWSRASRLSSIVTAVGSTRPSTRRHGPGQPLSSMTGSLGSEGLLSPVLVNRACAVPSAANKRNTQRRNVIMWQGYGNSRRDIDSYQGTGWDLHLPEPMITSFADEPCASGRRSARRQRQEKQDHGKQDQRHNQRIHIVHRVEVEIGVPPPGVLPCQHRGPPSPRSRWLVPLRQELACRESTSAKLLSLYLLSLCFAQPEKNFVWSLFRKQVLGRPRLLEVAGRFDFVLCLWVAQRFSAALRALF